MNHVNIVKPGRSHAVEILTLQLEIMTTERDYWKSKSENLAGDLTSIFNRVEDGQEVELWYDDNTWIEIKAAPKLETD